MRKLIARLRELNELYKATLRAEHRHALRVQKAYMTAKLSHMLALSAKTRLMIAYQIKQKEVAESLINDTAKAFLFKKKQLEEKVKQAEARIDIKKIVQEKFEKSHVAHQAQILKESVKKLGVISGGAMAQIEQEIHRHEQEGTIGTDEAFAGDIVYMALQTKDPKGLILETAHGLSMRQDQKEKLIHLLLARLEKEQKAIVQHSGTTNGHSVVVEGLPGTAKSQ